MWLVEAPTPLKRSRAAAAVKPSWSWERARRARTRSCDLATPSGLPQGRRCRRCAPSGSVTHPSAAPSRGRQFQQRQVAGTRPVGTPGAGLHSPQAIKAVAVGLHLAATRKRHIRQARGFAETEVQCSELLDRRDAQCGQEPERAIAIHFQRLHRPANEHALGVAMREHGNRHRLNRPAELAQCSTALRLDLQSWLRTDCMVGCSSCRHRSTIGADRLRVWADSYSGSGSACARAPPLLMASDAIRMNGHEPTKRREPTIAACANRPG